MNNFKTVAELIESPNRWTQRASARTILGDPCDPNHPDAVSFCLIGAVQHVYPDYASRSDAYTKLAPVVGIGAISAFNDNPKRTHAEILDVVRKANI